MAENNYVQMLIESLEKKVAVLRRIQVLCIEQKQILQDENAKAGDFEDNVNAKQGYIDQLDILDKGFQQIFEKVQPEIEAHREQYHDEILRMQELITDITDRSVDIQAREKANYTLAQQKFSNVRAQVKKVRLSNKAVSAYYKSMTGGAGTKPRYLDRKK